MKPRIRTFPILVVLMMLSAWAGAQTLVLAQGADAVTLDPHDVTTTPSGVVVAQIYEPLFMIQADGSIEPHLAEGYELSEDGLTLTLNIREGVTFHDGTPLDAEVVKGSLDRFLDPENGFTFRFLLEPIEEVVVTDDTTVELRLSEPFAPLVSNLAHGSTSIVLPSVVEEQGEEFFRNPVGTGPFVFESWTPNESIELSRNEDYWGDPVQLEGARFLSVPEGTTRMALVESGEAHVGLNVPPQDVPRLDALPDVSVDVTSTVRTIYVYFNVAQEPFDDPRVRRAINHAVDQEAIAEFVTGGAVRPSDAAIAPGVFGYSPAGTYEHDPELARELLAEAGYEDGFETTLYSPSGRYLQDIQIAETIQGMLAEVGITAEIETLEWAAYLQQTSQPAEETDVEMGLYGWGTVTADADYGLYPLLHSEEHVPEGSNRGFYANPELDALLEEARASTDPAEREELYAEALELIHEDAPWLFLHSQSQLTAVRDSVEGLTILPTERILLKDTALNE